MRKRLAIVSLAAALVVVLLGAVASAENHEIPRHPHMLLIDADIDFFPPDRIVVNSVGKCVDIANNQALRLNAHHDHFHFGRAGDALRNMTGNFPFPANPFFDLPWTDCETFLAVWELD